MPDSIPSAISGQKYISLVTFRKTGAAIYTPVWFGESGGKLFVMSRSDSGKYKRLRNNARIRVAPCTVRGKITGPEFEGAGLILPPEAWPQARKTLAKKYWLMRIPFFWSKKNVFIEISVQARIS
jgi:PPOX class probable F420-dependent enzyme